MLSKKTCLFSLYWLLVASQVSADELISRDALIEDSRQMLGLLESVHPQPYYQGGGKIAFHRRFQRVLAQIPISGMSREEYRGLLSPFVAVVGDAHTHIYPDLPLDFSGIPLLFYVAEKFLYVAAVVDEEHTDLLGAKLQAVEGIELSELVNRTRRYYGADNHYGTLGQLANFENFLLKPAVLNDLIPEWTSESEVNVTLVMPGGSVREIKFPVKTRPNWTLIRPEPQRQLPSLTGREFGWGFVTKDKATAYLRVRGMIQNRETYEKRATYSDVTDDAAELYQSLYSESAPKDLADTIESLPSLTEAYTDLVVQMKDAGTSSLVIDLRTNVGGWAFSADMLIYFLYGKDALIELHRRTNVATRKLSKKYFQSDPDQSLNELNAAARRAGSRTFVLRENDYDFSDVDRMTNGLLDRQYAQQLVKEDLSLSKTFYSEYASGNHSAYFQPKHIFVVTDIATFSAGFMFAKYLELMGAEVVGTTPSQNTLQMGETVSFELTNSGLTGDISRALLILDTTHQDVAISERLLKPDYELTYEKLKMHGFARDSAVYYAIELSESANLTATLVQK